MTDRAFVIGGTKFVGRHAVEEFLDHDYRVTIFNRGETENPFAENPRVVHREGDRTVEGELRLAAEKADPDVVVDCVAYHPNEVRAATDVFADADAYVYVSSGASYEGGHVPKREEGTPLLPCSNEQVTSDDWSTYGNRKAEGDRAVFAAAEEGVNAMAIRPPVIYGPHDYTERFDYWIDRVLNYERVLVPADAKHRHMVYVKDVASAIRTIAEEGESGENYNVGDDHLPTLDEWLELIADAAGTEVAPVFAGPRELAAGDVEPDDFALYRDYPHVLDTCKLRALGWRSTAHEEALAATVAQHRESDRTGREYGPDREQCERVLGVLDTV